MKRLVWSMVAVGITVCTFYGVTEGIQWAKNIALFVAWAGAVMGTLAVCNSEAKFKIKTRGPTIPRWLSIGSDFLTMCIFAASGMFWTAAAILWQIGCEASIYDID